MRAALALALAAGCAADLGPDAPWIPAEEIDGPMRPELGSDPDPAAVPDRLHVVSFNVHFGADVDRVAAALADADLVLVQEIEDHPGEGSSRASRLAAALGMTHAYAPARPVDDAGATHGLAILSRFPLRDVAVMQLPHADLAFNERDRIALAADVLVGDLTIRVVDIHLDTRIDIGARLQQLRPAVIEQPAPVIAGGDLNMLPWAWAGDTVPDLPAGALSEVDAPAIVDDFMAALGYDAPTANAGPTHGFPQKRLDSLYLRGLVAAAAGVDRDVDVSDHWPVWVDVDE